MFNEKAVENIKGKDCPVWQTPKYEQSKKKAIEIIEKGNYGLVESDFWVLMNTYANGTKCMYSGLILSHNGCLKINDNLEDKFEAKYLTRQWLEGTLIYEYNDGILYEVGEVNERNCQNNYIYAMAYKRCFDRVVLKKSKLAYSGIYSEVEADEFKASDEVEKASDKQIAYLNSLYSPNEIKSIMEHYKLDKIEDIAKDIASKYIEDRKNEK